MKLAALAFFALLAVAHVVGNAEPVLARPLSEFRDGDRAWLGYTLFILLLTIAGLHLAAQVRAKRTGDAAVSGLATVLLLAVALTPSWCGFHSLWSLQLLALLFGYYGMLLYRAESFWLIAHMAVPVVLAIATRFQSYGIWQKSFIAYFVVVAVVHHHVLLRQLPTIGRRSRTREAGGAIQSRRRRKVYRLDGGPAWRRRKSDIRGTRDER